MDVFFRRNLWMLSVAVVVVCAALAASAANHVLEAMLLGGASHRPPRPSARRAPREPPRSKDVEALVARNMFCSSCEAAAPAAPGDERPQPTSLPLRLVATNRAASGLHAATLTNSATGVTGSYRVGDIVADVGPVRRVGAQSVDVYDEKHARLERVELLATTTPAPAAAASPVQRAAVPTEPGIKQVAGNRYEIERALVEKTLADPMRAAGGTRIAPVIENGHATGFKLSGVRPSSILAQIGLENGDQIQSVNGMDLSSPDRAMAAFAKLRSASNLQLAINRRGTPVSLEYTIR